MRDGTTTGRIDDYLGLVARGSARWPIANSDMKFQLGLEGGYAPTTPTKLAVGTGGSGDPSGKAFIVSLNLLEIMPKHSFGPVYGEADAGWLLSPDFRSNVRQLEGRYKWVINSKQKVELRLRSRTDMGPVTDSEQKREDTDLYARYTIKF